MLEQEKNSLILKLCLQFENFRKYFLIVISGLDNDFKRKAVNLCDFEYVWRVLEKEGRFKIVNLKNATQLIYKTDDVKFSCEIQNFDTSMINYCTEISPVSKFHRVLVKCKFKNKLDLMNDVMFTFAIEAVKGTGYIVCREESYNHNLEPRYIDLAREIDYKKMASLLNNSNIL